MTRPDQRLVQRSGIETRALPEGAMLVDMDTGRCYRLNRVGAEIWSLLQLPLSSAEICAAVAAKYDREGKLVEADVEKLVAHLVSERLLQPAATEGKR